MDQRLERVLTHLIEDFIATAEPVGSQSLVKGHGLNVSPATIRNWFAELEAQGMLVQPHASAGRLPSEAAFRWYVSTQLGEVEAKDAERRALDLIRDEFDDLVTRAKACAKACTGFVGTAALIGSRTSDSYYTGLSDLFRQPEFHDWSRVVSMGSILDRLDERLAQLRSQSFSTPTVLLGSECPFGNACGSVMQSLPDGILLILLGPMRMDYRKGRNMLAAVEEVMNS
jgi:transcriptional regulator of heat shock response